MSTNLTEYQREGLEACLLAKNEQEQLKALEKLIQGSDEYNLWYFVTKQKYGTLSDQDRVKLDELIKNYAKHHDILQLRQKLIDFDRASMENDVAKGEKTRQEILAFLEKMLALKYDHQKPYNHLMVPDSTGQDEASKQTGQKIAIEKATLKDDFLHEDPWTTIKEKLNEGPDSIYRTYNPQKQLLDGMPAHLVHVVDFTKFLPEAVYNYATNLATQNQIAGIQNDTFMKQIKAYMSEAKKHNDYWTVDVSILTAMTKEQVDQLCAYTKGSTDGNVIGACFMKEFCDELCKENQSIWSNEEKLDNLHKLLTAVKAQGLPKSLQQSLKQCILSLGPKIGVYNMDLFKSYAAFEDASYGGGSVISAIGNAIKSKMFDSHTGQNWEPFLRNVIDGSSRQFSAELAQIHLEHFAFQNNGNLSQFKKKNNVYLSQNLIESIEDSVQIWMAKRGMEDLKENTRITAHRFAQESKDVKLAFCPHNREKFSVEEGVELYLWVKNVNTVHIKVFEFNTETYYRKTLQPFSTDLDLDGLESAITKQYTFAFPPNYKTQEKFVFEELKNKVGLFIFEFVGNGKAARAVVKKGSLSLIHRSTVAGHMAYILDDKKEICKGKKTGLWLGNTKFYEAKPDGSIFIPYGPQDKPTKVIMQHGNFSQLGDFNHRTESYSMTCKFLLNQESVLVGQNAQIIIKPQMSINGRKSTSSIIKNAKVVIKTTNYIDFTPITKNFEDLEFSDDHDTTVDFQVPANLNEIHIDFTAKVLNSTTKQLESFSETKVFQIQTNRNNYCICELYLSMVKDNNFEVVCLGKNGEPQPNRRFEVELWHSYLGQKTQTLYSDEEGKLYLGQLPGVLTLRVFCCDETDLKQVWSVPKMRDTWSYPALMTMLEGESLEIPVARMWNSKKPNDLLREQITFFRSDQGVVIDDCFKKLTLVRKENADSHYFLLQSHKLEAGEYTLLLRDPDAAPKMIKVTVHKGTFWRSGGNSSQQFILKKHCIEEIVQASQMIKIQSSSLSEDKKTLKLNLKDHSLNTRVHVFATKFVPTQITHTQEQIKELLMNKISSSTFNFARWSNLLLSDRQLSDEYRYVFDRVHSERPLGNLLDRPSLLNKKLFTRKTEMDQEQLQRGGVFQKKEEETFRPMMQNIMPMSFEACSAPFNNYRSITQETMSFGGRNVNQFAQYQQLESRLMVMTDPTTKADYLTEFQNFLQSAPLQIFNLKPDAAGVITISDPKLATYSTLIVVAADKESVVQHVRNLQNSAPIAKRNLTLTKKLDENKGLQEDRTHACLQKGAKCYIEDMTSSKIQKMDSIRGVLEIIREIQKIRNESLFSFPKLDIVLRWNRLSASEKNKYYSDLASHELHFFLKLRDNDYFENTVRGILKNKMVKDFVDFYLLDNLSEVVVYGQPDRLERLTDFERCLLIDALCRHAKNVDDSSFRVRAETITRTMRLQATARAKESANRTEENRIFDMVLNLNSLDQQAPSAPQASAMMTSERLASPPGAVGTSGLRNDLMMAQVRRMSLSKSSECEEEQEGEDLFNCDEQQNFAAFDDCQFSNQFQQNFNQEGFKDLAKTSEYSETYWLDSKNTQDRKSQLLFWCDYADYLLGSKKEGFLSYHFTECWDKQDAFFTVCLLDLPVDSASGAHKFLLGDGRDVTIEAGSNLILFKKEIRVVEVALRHDFMVTHRYTREDDYGRQIRSDDDEAVPEEFLMNTPYRCEVIMTNVSPERKNFSLLYQIPLGSMPIRDTQFMRSTPCSLEKYSTQRLSFNFYFPSTGKQTHYPSNVSIDGKVTARGEFNTLNVVKQRTIKKDEATKLNFADLVQVGTPDQILEYISTQNLFDTSKGFNFEHILYLCNEKSFWVKLMTILRERNIFRKDVWKFSFKFKTDLEAIREYLTTVDNSIKTKVGIYFESCLLSVDPSITNQGTTKHLEYFPMINARAHKVGQDNKSQILNKTFRQTYDRFLQSMMFKKKMTFADQLVFVYYLQLQDRVTEAIALFEQVKFPEGSLESEDLQVLEMQYDYLRAYFDFFTGAEDGYKVARRVVQQYDNYPVSHWRLMFLAIQDQLNEFDGECDDMGDMDTDSISADTGSQASLKLNERKQELLKKTKRREPNISDIQIDEKGQLTIETVNIKQIVIKYYIIDVEILFSRAPFLKNNAEEFSFVKPILQKTEQMVAEDADDTEITSFVSKQVPLPDTFKNQNLVIEISGEDQTQFKTFYSCELKVVILESYGELKVTHPQSGKAMPKVYVKVFAKTKNGQEEFYRDGYTDIRGKFEYAVSSSDKLKEVSLFSVLVVSEEFGASIKEVNPPKDESVQIAAIQTQKNVVSYAAGQEGIAGSMQQMKYNRMQLRNNYVQSNKAM